MSLCVPPGSRSEIHEDMSLDDLLGAVDRSFFYRYDGSLTTPTCNPAVVWTVFRESIRMDKKMVSVCVCVCLVNSIVSQRLHHYMLGKRLRESKGACTIWGYTR